MRPLEVVLFGGFVLRRGGDTVPPIPSRVGRSLFAYLVVNRGVPHARERLVAEFWPEVAEARGRRRLSHTLWQLQDALGELPGEVSYLEVTSDTLAFGPNAAVRVDVDEFEQGLERLRRIRADGDVCGGDLARLSGAIDLYRGDFLDGHYEPWVLAEQERLGQRYLEALALLVEFAKRDGSYDDALVYARRLANRAPLREDAHREVMRLSMLLDRPSEAIQQYERCADVLADELGTDPSAQTARLYDRIVRQQRPPADMAPARPEVEPFPERPPLVGRERERAAALGVLEAGIGGRGGGILVEGDPGVGKSRLIHEIGEDAEWRGYGVLATSCSEADAASPFGAIRALLDGTLTSLRLEHLRHRVAPIWLTQVARLVPALRRVLPDARPVIPQLHRAEGAQRMRDALVQVLLALSEVDPALIVVDDAHWADDESLEVLTALAGEVDDHRVALVLGYRTDEARTRPAIWDAVRLIDRRVNPARLLLRPLDPRSLGELVRAVARGRQIDPGVLARLQRETGGNPLFVVETLRELADADGLAGLGRLASENPAQLPLPGSIRDLVVSRLDRLPRDVRSVLEAAAVAGDRSDLDTLAAAVELPRARVVEAVDLLVRRSLVRELREGYGLHHDQVRRTSLDVMSAGGRRALHRRLGEALERHHPDDVERLAHHFEAAGASRRAIRYLHAAARRAVALHAYSTADAFYRRASEQQAAGPVSLTARFELLVEHEDVLDVLGERTRQVEVIDELAALAGEDPRRVVEVTRRRALLEAELGDLVAALELADDALAGAQRLGDPAQRGRALQAAAGVRSWIGRREEAVQLLEQAIDVGGRAEVVTMVRTTLASVLRELHRYDEAVRQLAAALDAAEEAGERREQARALGVLGSVHMETGDSRRAAELYRRSLATCEEIGFRRGEALNLVNLGNVLYDGCDVPARLEAYERAGSIFRTLAEPRGRALVDLNMGFVRHALLGDDRRACGHLEAAVAFFEEAEDGPLVAVCRETLASIAQRAGDLIHAQEQVALGFEAIAGAQAERAQAQLLQRRAEIRLAGHRYPAALGDIDRAVQVAQRHRLTELLPGARAVRGRVLLAGGEVQAAVEQTAAAVEGLTRGVECAHLIHLAHHDALVAAGRGNDAAEQARLGAAQVQAMLDALEPDDRAVALALPAHERLLTLSGDSAPVSQLVSVAAVDAPRGRALRSAELLEVRLELPRLGLPDDPVERRRGLLATVVEQILRQGGAPTVGDLAGILDVSEATIRRDLAALREDGEQLPTRGARTG